MVSSAIVSRTLPVGARSHCHRRCPRCPCCACSQCACSQAVTCPCHHMLPSQSVKISLLPSQLTCFPARPFFCLCFPDRPSFASSQAVVFVGPRGGVTLRTDTFFKRAESQTLLTSEICVLVGVRSHRLFSQGLWLVRCIISEVLCVVHVSISAAVLVVSPCGRFLAVCPCNQFLQSVQSLPSRWLHLSPAVLGQDGIDGLQGLLRCRGGGRTGHFVWQRIAVALGLRRSRCRNWLGSRTASFSKSLRAMCGRAAKLGCESCTFAPFWMT